MIHSWLICLITNLPSSGLLPKLYRNSFHDSIYNRAKNFKIIFWTVMFTLSVMQSYENVRTDTDRLIHPHVA